MRVVIIDFVSLDGVSQSPGGPEEDDDSGFAHGGWSGQYFDVPTMGTMINEILDESDALLFGRRTWQGMAAAWPNRAGDPFADRMNAIRKYVVTSTLTQEQLDWNNSTLLPADDVPAAVQGLRDEPGRVVQVWGSLTLARTLIANDLVDEYRFMIEPIMLGGGKSPFPRDGAARKLDLVSCQTSPTGVLIATYHPAR